ncbi:MULTISPECIES: DUF4258 domain-containing protein [unclassified Candidatus Frackibacter]|uniref:DUF4258 domain-containing protein n=1 Tax=unclassified Candidatus Frackibacter TaxID=2648818 RepID=UPI00079449BE|nr:MULTISPECIES: DUF4258 domain-containing protein [unclassified Candidatus Frackibacter]KXS42500.1 MAG: hypothetical protein AWU54_1311 [Candidatus Frackibacter sp. T328-2]SDC86729.1 protein of unknown function [Candidatus Frackibacter sp. WG11]SEN00969.1 protein of unknown function [Candidatus Frackibacter sp. WG12]SFM08501.1 protein of unknown function [Candidatus Frackibacter sp. WG13]
MLLTECFLDGRYFRIESTTHALQRMKERDIDSELVNGIILSLGEKLLEYNDSGDEIAIVDQENNLAVIIEVRECKAVVITVIDRANIHIKDGTLLEEIA